jgi:predicted PurR-regulated permease PerM
VSRPWSKSTKQWVITCLVVAGSLLLYRVRSLLPPVILACLLAYLLSPVVGLLARLRLSRTQSTAVSYLVLLLALVLAVSLLVPMVVQQVASIDVDLQQIYQSVLRIKDTYQTITFLDYTIELSDLFDQLQDSLIQLITRFASRSAEEMLGIAFGLASGFASTFVWLIFILVVSFWLLKDADGITTAIDGLVPPDYRDDVDALRGKIGAVWNSFFRGLLLLSFTVGVITGVLAWVVGVKNALLLGILAGVLEVVPTLGPIIACIPAVAVAYFQGSTHLPLAQGWFALLVLGLYVLIQQVENNFLAPRILGGSVKLHPLVVMVGAIGGYALGGIVGAFLAAPVIGTLKILGRYVYHKLIEVETPVELPAAVPPSAAEQRIPEAVAADAAEPDDAES